MPPGGRPMVSVILTASVSERTLSTGVRLAQFIPTKEGSRCGRGV